MKNIVSVLGTVLVLATFVGVKLFHHSDLGSSVLRQLRQSCGSDQQCLAQIEARFHSCQDDVKFASAATESSKLFMECFASDLAELQSR